MINDTDEAIDFISHFSERGASRQIQRNPTNIDEKTRKSSVRKRTEAAAKKSLTTAQEQIPKPPPRKRKGTTLLEESNYERKEAKVSGADGSGRTSRKVKVKKEFWPFEGIRSNLKALITKFP